LGRKERNRGEGTYSEMEETIVVRHQSADFYSFKVSMIMEDDKIERIWLLRCDGKNHWSRI
jgi:hypothetical protein